MSGATEQPIRHSRMPFPFRWHRTVAEIDAMPTGKVTMMEMQEAARHRKLTAAEAATLRTLEEWYG